jgi:hypothetical protein
MNRKTKLVVSLLMALAVLLLGSVPANSTTLVRMSVAQMTRAAQLVVRARCVNNSTAWDHGEIWTFSTFAVEETWKHSAAAAANANLNSYLTVRLLGGTVGNLNSVISGVPRFTPGEEVVLFLERSPNGDYSVVSWVQGTFRIHEDSRTGQRIAEQDTASFDTYDPTTHSFRSAGLRSVSIENLRALVQGGLCANANCAEGKN